VPGARPTAGGHAHTRGEAAWGRFVHLSQVKTSQRGFETIETCPTGEVISMLELQDSLDAAVTERIARREREAADWRLLRAARKAPPALPAVWRLTWVPRMRMRLHLRHP
jgi:hypothetical protein